MRGMLQRRRDQIRSGQVERVWAPLSRVLRSHCFLRTAMLKECNNICIETQIIDIPHSTAVRF